MNLLHHLPKQSGFDTAMWQKAGNHLKKKRRFKTNFASPPLSRIKCHLYLLDDKHTRGADIGRNAREKMTQKRGRLHLFFQIKLPGDAFT